jgi:hypothetical protein
MMMRDGRVHYGFFDDFAGGDSILFAGDRTSMQRLAALLRQVATKASGDHLPLNDMTVFRPSRSTDVSVELEGDCESCIREVKRVGDKSLVVWRLTRQGAIDAATTIDALVRHDGPGHQYLESTGDIQIIVSVDEYDESIFNEG